MARSTAAAEQRRITRKRLIVIGALTGIVALFVLFSPYGVVTRLSLVGTASDLREDVVRLRSTEDSLRTAIKRLHSDTTEIERLAREQYGYVRPGEDVFIVGDGAGR
ncbi:MAG: septum formation initiator family protein [Candidatus Kapabacteria bacterium]|jgi:cell division protein FtsB|nr:septum formation initiator family protein [Candidatus Kapabacteria bacterium]